VRARARSNVYVTTDSRQSDHYDQITVQTCHAAKFRQCLWHEKDNGHRTVGLSVHFAYIIHMMSVNDGTKSMHN